MPDNINQYLPALLGNGRSFSGSSGTGCLTYGYCKRRQAAGHGSMRLEGTPSVRSVASEMQG